MRKWPPTSQSYHVYYPQGRYEEALQSYQCYIELAGDNAHPSIVQFAQSLENQVAPTPSP